MPKVSQEFRDQQANRVLRAAQRCFAAGGFHATSMDQIIAEAGMSSSTVYRYFPAGKQALIHAVSSARIGPLLARLRELAHDEHPPSLEVAFASILQDIGAPGAANGPEAESDGPSRFDLSARLAVNAWAERARDPQLAVLMRENYDAMRAELAFLVQRWADKHMIVTPLGIEDTADVIQHVAFGVLAEQAIVGHSDLVAAGERLGRLFNTGDA
ncbi:MAG: TetR/AcrR family transcriptional regulator [Bifidobacterium mongoliense]